MLLGDPARSFRSARGRTRSSACRAAGPPDRARRAASARARRPAPARCARPTAGAGSPCSPAPDRTSPQRASRRSWASGSSSENATTRHASTAVSRRPERSDSAPIGRSRYSASMIRTPRSARGRRRRARDGVDVRRAAQAARAVARAGSGERNVSRPRSRPQPRTTTAIGAHSSSVRLPSGASASPHATANSVVAASAPPARRRLVERGDRQQHADRQHERLAGADRPEDPAPLERPEPVGEARDGHSRPSSRVLLGRARWSSPARRRVRLRRSRCIARAVGGSKLAPGPSIIGCQLRSGACQRGSIGGRPAAAERGAPVCRSAVAVGVAAPSPGRRRRPLPWPPRTSSPPSAGSASQRPRSVSRRPPRARSPSLVTAPGHRWLGSRRRAPLAPPAALADRAAAAAASRGPTPDVSGPARIAASTAPAQFVGPHGASSAAAAERAGMARDAPRS